MDDGVVDEAHHLTRAVLLREVVWRKSHRSNPSGDCVEFASLRTGQIAVRNSRDPGGALLICEREEIAALVQAAKRGDLDGLLTCPDQAETRPKVQWAAKPPPDTFSSAICTERLVTGA